MRWPDSLHELNRVKLRKTVTAEIEIQIQNTVSDQVFIFFPSNGPNGSMLNNASMPLPNIHV